MVNIAFMFFLPEAIISDKTFVIVVMLDKPVLWSEENEVKLVLLLCASKKNHRDLRILFDTISNILHSRNFVDEISSDQSYDAFIRKLKEALSSSNP